MIDRKKPGSKLDRAVLSGLASVPDFVNEALGINAMNRARGIHKKSAREAAQELYDKYLPGGAPETKTEKVLYSVPEYAATGLGSGVAKGAGKAANALSNFLKPTAVGAAGTVASETVLANDPKSQLLAISASLAPAGAKSAGAAAKNLAKTTGDIVRKGMLKMSPHRQEQVFKKIASDLGEESIASAEHIKGGKLNLKAIRKEREKLDTRFDKDFKKEETILGSKKDEMVVPTNDAVSYIMDMYKGLKNQKVKKKFLESPLGQQFKTLIGAESQIASKNIDYVGKNAKSGRYHYSKSKKGEPVTEVRVPQEKDITVREIDNLVHLNPDKLLSRAKMSYNDTKEFLDKIYDKLSNVSEIGTKEQGRLKRVAGLLEKSRKSVVKQSVTPEENKFINRLHSRYKGYATNQKQTFNKILDENAADLEGIYAKTNQAKPYLPTNKFIANNLSEGERSTLGKTYLRDLGLDGETLSPQKLQKNLSKLQSSERNYVTNLLTLEEQENLSKKLAMASKAEQLASEPSLAQLIPVPKKEKIADVFAKYSSPENTLEMLERDLGQRAPRRKADIVPDIGRETMKPIMQEQETGLTPEEESELQMLKSSMGEQNMSSGLTQAEEAELQALKASLG